MAKEVCLLVKNTGPLAFHFLPKVKVKLTSTSQHIYRMWFVLPIFNERITIV